MSMELTLWERFLAIKRTVGGAVFAISCSPGSRHLLMQGAFGEPALLLLTEPRHIPRGDIRLKHVSVSFDRKFEITNSETGSIEFGSYCKVSCESESAHLHKYFVELMAAIAISHEGELSQEISDSIVDALLEMFRKLASPSDRSISGLWGELLLISLAASPSNFINAWHSQVNDGFDFCFLNGRVEVKTSERQIREHEFSLGQVATDRGSDCIASILLSRSSAGLTVLDLARRIAVQVSEGFQEKLWRLVIETLGSDIEGADDIAFDFKSAEDSLVFIKSSDVPAPEIAQENLPFVSAVRFKSNIGLVSASKPLDKLAILGFLN